jgi:hypothetical protein
VAVKRVGSGSCSGSKKSWQRQEAVAVKRVGSGSWQKSVTVDVGGFKTKVASTPLGDRLT